MRLSGGSLGLRAARDLARLLREQGRMSEARGLLAPVYASFTEGFGFPDLLEARGLLEDLGAPPAAAGARGSSSGAAQPAAVPDAVAGPAPDC